MARKDIPSPGDTIHLSASELARAVKAGDLSAEEVVDAHIGRIQEVIPGPFFRGVVHARRVEGVLVVVEHRAHPGE